jgi:hypothetical protein
MDLYLLSQICVVISIILLGSTYFFKSKEKILGLCLIYNIFYGIHYLLLGAFTGTCMNLVSFIRNYWFYRNSKKGRKNSEAVLYTLFIISSVSCIFTYDDVFSLISLTASLLSTYSVWQDNVKLYKFIAIPVSICFIIYAVHLNSVVAVITEVGLLITEIAAIVKIRIENKKVNYCIDNV